jgi:hypothetical protein
MSVATETPWIATNEAARAVNWPEVAEYRLKHAAPFDPAAWLSAFAEAGGSYAVTSEGGLWLGIVGMAGCDVEKHTLHLIDIPSGGRLSARTSGSDV